MKNKEFELLISKEIIDSILNDAKNWETSIMGIRRKSDRLDLEVGLGEVSIHKPKRYNFQDKEIMSKLYSHADKLKKELIKEREKAECNGNVKELTDFFNLDSRKNKLEKLNEKYNLNDINLEKEEDNNKKSVWDKINIFKKKI